MVVTTKWTIKRNSSPFRNGCKTVFLKNSTNEVYNVLSEFWAHFSHLGNWKQNDVLEADRSVDATGIPRVILRNISNKSTFSKLKAYTTLFKNYRYEY